VKPLTTPATRTVQPAGPFSLAAAARFGRRFTPSPVAGDDVVVRLTFPCEAAGWRTVTAEARQDGEQVTIRGDVPEACADLERILSLDVDARPFAALAERDPVVAALQDAHPGLRPVLFPSPYQAAAWAIVSQRVPRAHAARIKARLAAELGDGAFPAPAILAALEEPWPGLPTTKVTWLRALGEAATDGALAPARLRALPADDALRELRRLPGIGPFGAELVLVRGAGAPDHLPSHEPRFAAAARAASGRDDVAAVAEAWRPFRSWVAFLLRQA